MGEKKKQPVISVLLSWMIYDEVFAVANAEGIGVSDLMRKFIARGLKDFYQEHPTLLAYRALEEVQT